MDPIRTIRLRWLHGTLSGATQQLAGLHFSQASPHYWRPAINAYRCETSIRICVDLAGIERSQVDLTIFENRLSIRGVREVPEPGDPDDGVLQMIAMEIDYGAFEREIQLPDEVEVKKVSAEQENGLLWIHLPLRKP